MREELPIWDVAGFFKDLTARNKLAAQYGFKYVKISGLTGLEDAIETMQQTPAFVCVSDSPFSSLEMGNTPHFSRTVMVVLAMRHKLDDAAAREQCIGVMTELFRQFMSVVQQQDEQLKQNMMFLDNRVTLQVLNKYLTPGTTSMVFEITTVSYADFSYQEEDWTDESDVSEKL